VCVCVCVRARARACVCVNVCMLIKCWSLLSWKAPVSPTHTIARVHAHTCRLQVVGSTAYHHMSGPSVLSQTRDCATAYNSTKDPNPAHFASNEFLDSTIAFENGTVVSLVHTE
jgi:hypothetical protein